MNLEWLAFFTKPGRQSGGFLPAYQWLKDPPSKESWDAVALLIAMKLWLPMIPGAIRVGHEAGKANSVDKVLSEMLQPTVMGIIARELAFKLAERSQRVYSVECTEGARARKDLHTLKQGTAPGARPVHNMGQAHRDQVPNLHSGFLELE